MFLVISKFGFLSCCFRVNNCVFFCESYNLKFTIFVASNCFSNSRLASNTFLFDEYKTISLTSLFI